MVVKCAPGVIGAAKVILYEISDNTNQGVGMSAISVAWGAGVIMGPLISGQRLFCHSTLVLL